MKHRKPLRSFTVTVGEHPQPPITIAGETFFAAQAACCLRWMNEAGITIEPQSVRLYPPRKLA